MIKSGFVNIIKPTGMTSSDVVFKVKKILGTKKVGHLGTLDPAASGVLPVAFGKATKFFDYFLKKDKIYIADVKFGILTDTLDSFGRVIDRDKNALVSEKDILSVLDNFTGKISQIPPIYSAIKINGKKACDLARMGKDVEINPRQIEIYSIDLLGEINPNMFRFRVHCSAGTYIRTLFNDIAQSLNTIATTPVIIRVKSGNFKIDNAITLDDLQENKQVISIDELFGNLIRFNVNDEYVLKKIENGVRLNKGDIKFYSNENFLISHNETLIGMYHFQDDKLICDVFLME